MKSNSKQLLILILLSLFLGAIPSKGLTHGDGEQAFNGEVNLKQFTQAIEVSDDAQRAIGLKVSTVKRSTLQPHIQVTGMVKPANNGWADLSATLPGIVKQILVKEGDTVRKGQVLAVINSPDATRLLSDFLQQKATLQREMQIQAKQKELAKTNLDREKRLLEQGISSKKDYMSAQNNYDIATTSLSAYRQQISLSSQAAQSQLQAMGSSAHSSLNSGITIVSPINGVVAKRTVTLGETVDLNKTLFSIANIQPIWVVMDVAQNQIGQVQLGQSVTLTTDSNKTVTGTISSIGVAVDSSKRTIPVRVIVSNSDSILKPEMFVKAAIAVGQVTSKSIILPNSAVVDVAGQQFVYVQEKEGLFQPVAVKTGLKTSDAIQITDGLFQDDIVVTEGASQLRSQSILAKEEHEEKENDNTKNSSSNSFMQIGLSLLAGLIIGVVGVKWLGHKNRNTEV